MLAVTETSASNCHLSMDFCALLVGVACGFEVGNHRVRCLLVENMVFLQAIEVDRIFRDLVK